MSPLPQGQPDNLTPLDDAESAELLSGGGDIVVGWMELLNQYAPLFVLAFLVTLLATPVIRRMAIAGGVVDHPDAQRKLHRESIPYLGGIAVFLGIIAALALSYFAIGGANEHYQSVPIAIIIGIVAITFTGLADDVWGWDPRLKIMGQLIAAAALAIENIGVDVAAGMLAPLALWLDPILGSESLVFTVVIYEDIVLTFDVVYWTGTAIIALFVLGGCNAANLIDGLDGLLSGTVAIIAVGLLAISVLMASEGVSVDETSLAGARIVLCFALLGAVLGFLPHNFNPATIFLGDCGSLLLGYISIVIILMFGEHGETHLVFAGLIVFGLPIMDTTLAIIRRRLAGTALSAGDDQHMHHQLRRAVGGVKRAVISLYGISTAFALVGVTLAALVMKTNLRVRVIYAIALVLFSFIGVIAVKAARRQQLRMAGAKRKKTSVATTSKQPDTQSKPDTSRRLSESA